MAGTSTKSRVGLGIIATASLVLIALGLLLGLSGLGVGLATVAGRKGQTR